MCEKHYSPVWYILSKVFNPLRPCISKHGLLKYWSLQKFITGTVSEFKRKFENPILRGRDADASDADHKKGAEKLAEVKTKNNPNY